VIRDAEILLGTLHNYRITASLGREASNLVATSVVVDTGAGASIISPEALPGGWDAAITPHPPGAGVRLRDANGNQLGTSGTISLLHRAGGLCVPCTVHVVASLSVPALLGCDFLDAHAHAILPSDRAVRWRDGTASAIVRGPNDKIDRRASTSRVLRLAYETKLAPRSATIAWVRTPWGGLGQIFGASRLMTMYRATVANGVHEILPDIAFLVVISIFEDCQVTHRPKTAVGRVEAEAAEVERQLAADVIEPTSFDWGFHVVLVPKNDGTLRFCVDYRLLNAVTKRDSYQLPRMDECIESLGEANVFSTLDCNAGYWKVLIADGDREKTAFVCHKGAYHYKRMPFGLTNAPTTFQRALDIILSGAKWQSCLVYLDDVIVYSKTPEAHVQHLDEVLGLLRAAGVTLNLPKFRFFRTTVEYLGHEITPGRLSVLQAHTKALRVAAFPMTRTRVRSFIGMCNVFRRFVPNFARIATPLTDLMGSTAPVTVPPPTANQLFAFEELKRRPTQPTVLALPRAGHKYVFDVDACGTQVGAALQQEQQEGGLCPVAFISCVLEGAERAFGVTEKECLAVVWASLKLRAYLECDRFLVWTDHDCLRWLLNIDGTAHGRLARWRMRLNELFLDISYKPGQTYWLADGMSRLVTSGADRSADDTDLPVFAVTRAETARGLETANYVSRPTTRAIDKGEVATAKGEDPLCRKVVEALNAGRAVPFFEDSDGLVCRRATHDGVAQIFVPEFLQERVLRLEHETKLAGHPGKSRMYAAMRRYYYWPGMTADVVLHVRNCGSCARGRVNPLRVTAALQLFPATLPFQDIATDLFGPLTKTAAGHEYIMVITDRFSKLVRTIPMGQTRAVDCASVLLDYWIGAYGAPDRVLSDGGPLFTAQLWHQVCNLLSVESKVTTPSRPQTNGQAELFNWTMGRILDHYVAEHPTPWDQLLPALTLAYNTQPHAATKVAPLELVTKFGVASWSIKDLTRKSRYSVTAQRGSHAENKEQAAFLTRLVRLIPRIREALTAAQHRYKRNNHARIRPQPTGQEVGRFSFKHHLD